MYQTLCYEDNYFTHLSGKEGSEYWPQRKKCEQEPNQDLTLIATQSGRHLKLIIQLAGQQVQAIIDSGATRNFVNLVTQVKLGLEQVVKPYSVPLTGLDGSMGQQLIHETGLLTTMIWDHIKQLNFNIAELRGYEVVFGIPQLRKYNPQINQE